MLITEFILIVAVLCFTLGIYTWLYDRHSRLNKLFGFSTCLVGLWVFLNYLFDLTSSVIVLRLIYAVAPFLLSSIALWIASLKYKKFKPWFIRIHLAFLVFNAFLIYLSLFTIRIVDTATSFYEYKTGTYFNYYSAYNLVLFVGYICYFVWEYKNADKVFRDQMRFIIVGIITTVAISSLVGFILPAFGITRYNIFDSPSSIFFIVFSVYSIMKYKFLNMKVIATEVFATFLMILSFRGLIQANGFSDMVAKLFIFVVTSIFGILLIRSVIAEVRRREEMERLSAELEHANQRLRELDQAKTDFLSMASHQLRSPLTVVRLGLGALMDGTFGDFKDQRQMDAAKKMLESTNRLINLIGEYLNISRIEMGKMKYEFKSQDLCALVKDIVEEYQPRAQAKQLTLTFTKGGEVPAIVFDEEKLRHVIVNLVDNAIKYTPKGSVAVSCEVARNPSPGLRPPSPARGEGESAQLSSPAGRGEGDGRWVRVSVQDTGLGLGADDIAVLFQKFRRAESANIRRREGEPIEGSGLGLHVAKMFVDKHGGKIWAESPGRDKGSSFIVSLPLAGPPPLPADEIGEGGKGVEMPK